MKVLGLTFLLIINTAMASTHYDLKFDLFLHGKHVASPRVMTKEGEIASIIQKTNETETFIDVVATKAANMKNAVLMNFTIGTINTLGERTTLSKAQIISKENKTATITQHESDGRENLSLTVIAKTTL